MVESCDDEITVRSNLEKRVRQTGMRKAIALVVFYSGGVQILYYRTYMRCAVLSPTVVGMVDEGLG